jgi:hypothetical protein
VALDIREVGQTTDPVHCTVCNVIVLPPDDGESLEPWDPAPACVHVWGLWHDHGVVYLSPAAQAQLAASGVLVHEDPDLGIELEVSEDPESEDDRGATEILASIIHGPGAVVLAVYTGPPAPEGSYVGVAEHLS